MLIDPDKMGTSFIKVFAIMFLVLAVITVLLNIL